MMLKIQLFSKQFAAWVIEWIEMNSDDAGMN